MSRISLIAAAAAATLALSLPAFAQSPPADALTDPTMKAPEVIAFIGLKPGQKVADVIAGRFVRALSQAVGPKGVVYAYEPDEIVRTHPEAAASLTKIVADPAYANVKQVTAPINAANLPKGLDAVFIRQNYHDLYDKFMGPADVPGFNKQVFAALKPGGVYVILDHADAAGTGIAGTETRHRIDEARVKEDVLAAGFKLDGESQVLANPADDHSKMVFAPAIRGKTDQFLLRFKKPK
ncbi:MAG: class I SAM-dependent methyltransferase [Phenylobacterium sp.]